MPRKVGKALEEAVHGPRGDERAQRAEAVILSKPRRRILEVLCARPVLSLSQIARRTGMGSTTCRWHLGKMAEAGYVASVKRGRTLLFYPVGLVERDDVPLLEALGRGTTREVYLHLTRHPGLSQRELTEALGVTQQAVHRAASKLLALRLLTTVENGRFVRYYPTSLLAERRESMHPRGEAYLSHILKRVEREVSEARVHRMTDTQLVVDFRGPSGTGALRILADPFASVLQDL
jgi:DNA-binding transcriptional ArsR family regulator